MSLFNTLHDFCVEHGLQRTYWVAYSGGLDSHVLLHLLVQLRLLHPLKLRALHIHHGLSPNADAWAEHCETVCRLLEVDYSTQAIDAKAITGESPEAIARERRYAVFADTLAEDDVLLTAHHQDDQAETLLLQLFRGAGIKGLAAMPREKILGKGVLARPLLVHTRAELEVYARDYALSWIDDESNSERRFSRNYIRHDIMPLLKKRWPSITTTLARSAANCGEVQQFINQRANEDVQTVRGSQPHTLSVQRLLMLGSDRQRHALRFWLHQLAFPMPSVVKLQQIQHDMLHARIDKAPHIMWQGIEVRRYQDNLYAMPCLASHDATQTLQWDLKQPIRIEGIGELHAIQTMGRGLRADILNVSIRFRQGGETCQLPGRDCHHQLKHLFQECDVPPWKRNRIPLIYVNEMLVSAVGLFVCEGFIAKEGEAGYHLVVKGG